MAKSAVVEVIVSQCQIKVIVPLEGLVDLAEEVKRLQKNLEKIDKTIEQISKRLGNESFVKNAAPEVVVSDREQLEVLKSQKITTQESMERLL